MAPHAPPPAAPSRYHRLIFVLAVLTVLVGEAFLALTPALAQTLSFPPVPKRPPEKTVVQPPGQQQMLVQANEIDYDYANHRVSAVGNVQIYYKGSRLEADRVIYDQTTKRLHAEGNVTLTDQDRNVTHGTIMDLSDDYRNGFVDSLRLDAPDQTRFAAARAERSAGNFTVFQNGVYTACAPCKDDPRKPPQWQVKAVRIIHDQKEKMLYFENAQLEFFGTPLAWMPYFSAPDPTVKRKTGFLTPSIESSSAYGVAVEVPYYWALAPDYDLTFAPMITTNQGLLLEGEFRQRLINGAYDIRAAGIRQAQPDYFVHSDGTPTPGDRDWRGSLESSGVFDINSKWVWGWDAVLLSDKTFLQDYNPRLSSYRINNALQILPSEGISQLFLVGKGDRSYFEARSIYYLGFSESDVQTQIPVIHPVIDYKYTFDHPVLGGELGFKMNFTSLTRVEANFDAITQAASLSNMCSTADPSIKTSMNCLLRGAPGTYSRFSTEAQWRRTFTDPLGQQWTPFALLRADAGAMQITDDPSVSNYLPTGDSELVRAMPAVGLEYRYPFISVASWGTQTFEPIVQVIARPNEPQVGRWPNEDAQTLIFDDSNLFRINKFSGWDRVEGGGRANYGVQYTLQFNRGGFINALFGQSYQLFGQNSYAVGDTTNTGLDSGLDKTRSDYVARLSYQPNSVYTFSSRFRFDSDDFEVKRLELEGRANFDRWNLSVLYGDYAPQPEIGYLTRRQGFGPTTQIKLDSNWVLTAGALYDFEAKQFVQTTLGLGYIDDCLILAVNYITSYTYSGNPDPNNHQIMLQLTLRTLGDTSVSQSVGSLGGL